MSDHSAILTRLAELRATAEAADNPHWLKMITDALEGGPWCGGCSIVDDASGNVAVVPIERCREIPRLASALGLEETA